MPQFNPEWFASQIFWLVVLFVVLYFLMSRVALPRMAQIMEERQDKIEDDLAKAEKLKAEADEIYQAYEQRLTEARQQAQRLFKETADEVQAKQQQDLDKKAAELEQRIREAEQRIEADKRQALDNLQSVAGEVAQDAVAKLMGEGVAQDKAEKAVQSAMKQQPGEGRT
jgi:F-type H+-transporting ATPase subunit b